MVISARWQNRNPQILLLHRDSDLMTLYGTRNLYENSRNHLRGCSTPGKFKAKNNHIEVGKKSYFFHGSPFPKPTLQQNRSKQPTCSFSLKREKEK